MEPEFLINAGAVAPRNVPASFNQEGRLMFEEILRWSGRRYPSAHLRFGLKFEGTLDPSALEAALNEIVRRHTALRTAFVPSAKISPLERTARLRAFANSGLFAPGLFQQLVLQSSRLNVPVIDITEKVEAKRLKIQLLLEKELLTPFEYDKPPLMRAKLLRLEATKHLLIVLTHNLVSDWWSHLILQQELKRLCQGAVEDGGAILPEPRAQFAEFACIQHQQAFSSHFDPATEFWRRQFERFESAQIWYSEIPFALASPARPTWVVGTERIKFDKGISREIHEFAEASHTTARVAMLTAFLVLMRRITQKSALAIHSSFPNRTRPALEDGIGWFANSHLIAVDVSAELSGREFIDKVHDAVIQADAHQEIPPALLWRRIGRVTQFADVRISFNVLSARGSVGCPPAESNRLIVTPTLLPLLPNVMSSVGLGVSIVDTKDGFVLTVTYSLDRFTASSIREMSVALQAIVAGLVDHPNEPITRIGLKGLAGPKAC